MIDREFDIKNTLVAVMSFNRGECLLNCVSSIRRYIAGAQIVVFDDCSSLPATRRILSEISRQCEVVVRQTPVTDGVLGGLYVNMNKAVQVAQARGLGYVFFVQDDQQIVRALDNRAVAEIRTIFGHDKSITLIHPGFWKGYFPRQMNLSNNVAIEDMYYLNPQSGDGDTGIVDLRRMRAADFKYANYPSVNKSVALERGLRAVSAKNPFVMHTPWPKTIRQFGWKGRVLSAVNDWGVSAGCNPFCDMDGAAIRRLLERPISVLPIADVYLKTHKKLKQPWFYSTPFDRDKIFSIRELVTLRWIFDGSGEYMAYRRLLSDEDWRYLGLKRPLFNRLIG